MKKNELIKKIKEIETLSNDEKTALIELLSSQKRYGLVWEDKPEAMEEELRHKLPILKEVVDKRIIADKTEAQTEENDNNLFAGQENGDTKNNTKQTPPNHILIEGDNLHALSVLNYTHAGKVDVIYIDPPYNTGNKDFKYNDRFVDKEDSYRHSKWLSFMNKRLKLAKNLLKDSGVIFISIDDNEQAQLKLLCDEVFGEENFVAILPTIMNLKGNNDQFGFSGTHEYSLVFVKNINSASFLEFDLNEDELKDWNKDEIGYFKKGSGLLATSFGKFREERPFMYFPLLIKDNQVSLIKQEEHTKIYNKKENTFNDSYIEELRLKYEQQGFIFLLPINSNNEKLRWTWGFDGKFQTDKHEIIVSNISNNYTLYKKQRPNLGDIPSKKPKSIFYKPEYSSGNGTNLLKEIFNLKSFVSPKPLQLIYDFLKISSHKHSTILDFFAGSGTTLHATMQLNAEDGGNRQCILVTNNENNIAEEVCYERNKRVINGYTKPNGDKVAGLKNNNLRYYKTEFVDSTKTLKNRTKVMELAKDMLCIKDDCYNEITDLPLLTDTNFTSSKIKLFENENIYLMIIYDEQEIDNAIEIIKTLDKKVNVYIFSAGQYPFTDDFEEVLDKVELCALPEAIYKAYKSILPKKKAEVLIETEIEEIEPKENESNDFDELEGN